MKASRFRIENLLDEICGQIGDLNVNPEFKQILWEDVELAKECFRGKNCLCILNCLGVLAGKLQTYLIFSSGCHHGFEKLLMNIHCLQQILLKLPVCIIGPAGPTGATGPAGPAGCMGATGPTGPGGSTISTCSIPVSCFPNVKKAPQSNPQSNYFDHRTHVVIYCHSHRNR